MTSRNLKKINSCFLNHWCDFEVQDTEVSKLEARITNHATKEPIDYSQRTLVRIFSNGSFKQGGRFYRGWWQQIDKEDRSKMNVTFNLTDASLKEKFDSLCVAAGISALNGHRSVGGYRASIYNALPLESVNVLIKAMQDLNK